jgi:hypothetical protein
MTDVLLTDSPLCRAVLARARRGHMHRRCSAYTNCCDQFVGHCSKLDLEMNDCSAFCCLRRISPSCSERSFVTCNGYILKKILPLKTRFI